MNNPDFQPAGKHTVTCYLILPDVPLLIDFVQKVFDGTLSFMLNRPDGKIMHAEIKIGDTIIMAGTSSNAFEISPGGLFIYVRDCDLTFKKALARGAVEIMPPTTMYHAGERYGGVKDQNGNVWWIATHQEDLTPEEQKRRILENNP